MLDQNTANIKEFVGKVVKTLPQPNRIEASRKWLGTRKVVVLYFQCPDTYFEFKVESTSWSLWLKFAVSFAQIGKAIVASEVARNAAVVANNV